MIENKAIKEPWDCSSKKAYCLKIEDFGTPDEFYKMAKPIRMANCRNEAAEILKEISIQGTLSNKNGLTVTISRSSRTKIVSSKALNNSYSQKAHYLAVANLDKLFMNSIEPWGFELNPNKNNNELKNRRYLYAPLEYDNKIIPVKITVKEYLDTSLGKRLYSVEAINVEIK
ncbi:MAG: hypothetical protein FWD13_03175 [Treponema sp.]|nr:hypothetical protein [Treponema sp.]